MNYIKHLNSIMKRFSVDERLNPTHISLYMALFQFWNYNHFPVVIYINREEVMKMSKIGSMATYHRCLKQLHKWNYIVYLPTHNPFKSSQIKFFNFGTTTETSNGKSSDRSTGETFGNSDERVLEGALASEEKQLKQIENNLKRPEAKQEVHDFFNEKKWPPLEAEKFYNHYEAVGWKIGGKIGIENWKAVAQNWILRADESEIHSFSKRTRLGVEHLKIVNDKNYGKPL